MPRRKCRTLFSFDAQINANWQTDLARHSRPPEYYRSQSGGKVDLVSPARFPQSSPTEHKVDAVNLDLVPNGELFWSLADESDAVCQEQPASRCPSVFL